MLHVFKDVRIQVGSDSRRRAPQNIRDQLHRHPGPQRDCSKRVSQAMEGNREAVGGAGVIRP